MGSCFSCNLCGCCPTDPETGRLDCCAPKKQVDSKLSESDESKWRGFIKDEHRGVTDLLCAILYLLFMLGFIIIGAIALAEGEPGRLIAGSDYEGRTCGYSDGVTDLRYTMYPRTNEDIIANIGKAPQDYSFYGICVSECNTKETGKNIVVVCNDQYKSVNNFQGADQAALLDSSTGCFGSVDPADSNTINGASVRCSSIYANCWIVPVYTSSILRRCIPVYEVNNNATSTCAYPVGNGTTLEPTDSRCVLVTESSTGTVTRPRDSSILFDQLNDASQTWGRYINDLRHTWWVIAVCSVVIGLVLGYLFLFAIKYAVGVIVWLTIILTLLLSVALTVYLYYRAGVLNNETITSFADRLSRASSTSGSSGDTSNTQTVDQSAELDSSGDSNAAFRIAAYVMTAVSIIVLVLIIALRKSVAIAIEVIKLGSKAVNALGIEAILAPLLPTILLFGFLAFWLFVTVSLFSVPGTPETVTSAAAANASAVLSQFDTNATVNYVLKVSTTDKALRYMIIYEFFGMLWTNQFLIGITIMGLSGGAAGWYFSKGGEAVEAKGLRYAQPNWPVLDSLRRAFCYHAGTVAFGSLLIATVQFIRAVMYYIEQQARKGKENNVVLKYVFLCVQCFLWCIECLLKIITRNAYIVTSIKGWSFCPSAMYSLSLIANNFSVVAFVNSLAEIIMFLGKCFVAALCAFAALGIIENTESFQEGGEEEVSAAWLPGMVTFLFAYIVATAFFIVFDIAVDTVLVCYIMDRDENYRANGNKESERKPIHIEGEDAIAELKEKHKAKQEEDDAPPAPAGGPGGARVGTANPIGGQAADLEGKE